MSFKQGDKVEHANQDWGVGTIVEDSGQVGGLQTWRVAWPGGAGGTQSLQVPEDRLRQSDEPPL